MKRINKIILILVGVIIGIFIYKINYHFQFIKHYTDSGKGNIFGVIKYIGNINENNPQNISKKYGKFEQIESILKQEYYNQKAINREKMLESALKAYVDALEDPYTVYMDNKQNSGFENSLKGEENFEGIGAVISKKDYYVLVEEVIKDSPAHKAGLKHLDRIIFVDTGSVKDLDINQAVEKIKGPKGTKVVLTVERRDRKNKDEYIIVEIVVERDEISVPSVKTKILEDNIAYINISIIGEETEKILVNELYKLLKKDVKGLIIDLRGNGGGLLPIAVEIASHFVPKGELIVSSKYHYWEDEYYYSRGYGTIKDIPTVVLIDGMTASAGEIIALALQEQIGAKIVGTKSFGKGSIQTMENFSNGDSIKYTIGKRYSPNGKNIDIEGINPDIVEEFDVDMFLNKNIDNQVQKALSIIKNRKKN